MPVGVRTGAAASRSDALRGSNQLPSNSDAELIAEHGLGAREMRRNYRLGQGAGATASCWSFHKATFSPVPPPFGQLLQRRAWRTHS